LFTELKTFRTHFYFIFIIHKPSLWPRDVPQKIWARSFQPFWRLLDTNKQTDTQTDKQTDKPNLYIDNNIYMLSTIFFGVYALYNIHIHIYKNKLLYQNPQFHTFFCTLHSSFIYFTCYKHPPPLVVLLIPFKITFVC